MVNEAAAKSTIGQAIRYQETLSQQRKMQPSVATTEAPRVLDTGQGQASPIRDGWERKPHAANRRQNPMTVPQGLARSIAPQAQQQSLGLTRSLIDPQMVEFAFEFDLSSDEESKDQKPSHVKKGGSDGSLFSTDELDAVLSVASSVPTRSDSPTTPAPPPSSSAESTE